MWGLRVAEDGNAWAYASIRLHFLLAKYSKTVILQAILAYTREFLMCPWSRRKATELVGSVAYGERPNLRNRSIRF